ncbi:SCO family protein [Halocola ammonii]
MKKEKPEKISLIFSLLLLLGLASCTSQNSDQSSTEQSSDNKRLPYFGTHGDPNAQNPLPGEIEDSLIYTVPKWSLINQDSQRVSQKDYEGKIYVTDFFFSTCPSICPVMSSQMARLQDKIKKAGLSGEVMFLSHTVDPENDRPDTLKAYAEELGVDLSNWNFVTGNKDDIYYLAEEGYFVNALPAETAPGGFIHTDNFILIDEEGHIRGYYDGTSTRDVDKLFEDLKKLVTNNN